MGEDVTCKFADVRGLGAIEGELREVVEFLEQPEKFRSMNAKLPAGLLLCGPPGTGKTLLARAVAGEAGVPFFAVSGSEFLELFVGLGAARVRQLFEGARKAAPCIIFIDEIDAIGGRRGGIPGGSNNEREQTLNQLLTEIDGFYRTDGLVVIGATNRADILDPALVRPGRLSRRILVDVPNLEGRQDVLAYYLGKAPLSPDLDREAAAARLALLTPSFSGAELENVVNEAALLALRGGKGAISMEELVAGIGRTRFGIDSTGGSPLPGILGRLQSAFA